MDTVGFDVRTRRILLAPLHQPALKWTSTQLAEFLGTSQSDVARVWRRTYAPVEDNLAIALNRRRFRIIAASINAHNSIIALAPVAGAVSPVPSPPPMRSPRRPVLQTLLAADCARSELPHSPMPVMNGLPDGTFVLARRAVPEIHHHHQCVVVGEQRWQKLLFDLLGGTIGTPMSDLQHMHAQLLEWAQTGRAGFEWRAGSTPPRGPQPNPSPLLLPIDRAIAQDAFRLLLQRIASGELAAGDRITETSLQRSLHTSRNHVRDALRDLALGGLVELAPNRGAFVPIPKTMDVVDTYAARRALGTLLVERAATAQHRNLSDTEAALANMLRLAETGNARATGDADVHFQNCLANATEMRHVPDMFRALSSQVLLFTTVLGLRYVYSIPDMCHDDIAILKAVKSREPETAVAAWHRKVDAAMTFMTAHL